MDLFYCSLLRMHLSTHILYMYRTKCDNLSHSLIKCITHRTSRMLWGDFMTNWWLGLMEMPFGNTFIFIRCKKTTTKKHTKSKTWFCFTWCPYTLNLISRVYLFETGDKRRGLEVNNQSGSCSREAVAVREVTNRPSLKCRLHSRYRCLTLRARPRQPAHWKVLVGVMAGLCNLS